MTQILHRSDPHGADGLSPLAVQVVRQYFPNRGGLEDVVANLSRQLLLRGYRVRVITLDRLFAAPDRVLPAREIIDGVEIVRIPFSGSPRYPIAPQVFRHLGDADIVHVHAIDFFFDALAWGWPLHRKPLVATTHGGFFHTPRHTALKTLWFNMTTRLSAIAYRRLIGCSLQDTRLFNRIAGKRVIEIENGADAEKFAGAGSPSPVRRIATIGRFSVNKRLDRLLDAMVPLTAMHGEWHLDIIGVPGDHSAADIAAMIEARGLAGRVDLHVGLSNEDIRAVLGRSSFFASASDYEGFGLVAIEAMSAGLMPLLNPNPAYRDLAGRHDEIRLCDFADAEAAAQCFTSAFAELEKDPASYRRSAMTTAAAYSWDQVSERYARVYRDVLGLPETFGSAVALAERSSA